MTETEENSKKISDVEQETPPQVLLAEDVAFSRERERDFHKAFKQWALVLKEENICFDQLKIKNDIQATFRTKQKILGWIKPENKKELKECLNIANKFQVNVYTVSKGFNWGLGSKVPVVSDAVIIDLELINKIVDFSEDDAYIVVQPGVSFQDVYEYLEKRQSNLFVNVIGGPPEASIIGNLVERGDGIGPLGDRANYACAFEVILADGNVLNTGYRRVKNSKIKNLCKYGVGPSIDGLFVQSNLGIVIEATIWLSPKPKYLEAFEFESNEDEKICNAINFFKSMYLHKTISSAIFIWNDYKQLSTVTSFPWKETKNLPRISEKLLRSLRKKYGIKKWYGFGALYIDNNRIKNAIKGTLSENFKKLNISCDFMNTRKYMFLKPFKPIILKISENIYRKITLWEKHPFLGRPVTLTKNSIYWRKRSFDCAQDPGKDMVGLYWQSFMMPFNGSKIIEISNRITDEIKEYNFEPGIGIMLGVEGRSVRIFFSINYDREIKGEDKKAEFCHQKIFEMIEREGYTHNRVDINSMCNISQSDESYISFLKSIKQHLDNEQILSLGRYI